MFAPDLTLARFVPSITRARSMSLLAILQRAWAEHRRLTRLDPVARADLGLTLHQVRHARLNHIVARMAAGF